VQAQQLLDIVLSQQNNAEAIAAAIDVHQQLLQDSVNFWLSHWLEQQIKLLQAKA
jgi:hypothetical protein